MKIRLKTWSDICQALCASVRDMSLDEVKIEAADRRSPGYFFKRMMRVYDGARERSARYGYVGVGCISFAEARLAEYQDRLDRMARLRMDRNLPY